jgi:pantoate--beta-alanine ligase
MTTPRIVHTVSELRAAIADWRGGGARIGLVPTMGALHDGHLSLIQAIGKYADRIVVSIFVNPAQFAPHEDFDSYPRNLDGDCARLAGTGADLVFAPTVREMYPDGFATRLSVGGPAEGLESDHRPHFFGGVATIVSKLLIAAMPDAAMFGEKDYQQLLVIRRMVTDLALPVAIPGGAIMREKDGLAMSSRNAYLSQNERAIAGQLNVVLKNAIARLKAGDAIGAVEVQARDGLLEAGFAGVDYVAVRDAKSLAKINDLSGPARILAAAKVGTTRLIDNMAV